MGGGDGNEKSEMGTEIQGKVSGTKEQKTWFPRECELESDVVKTGLGTSGRPR